MMKLKIRWKDSEQAVVKARERVGTEMSTNHRYGLECLQDRIDKERLRRKSELQRNSLVSRIGF